MSERDESSNEVLLKVQRPRLKTLDHALEKCLPTLAARLWATCCWPRSISEGWKIGDYNFLILSTSPEKDTEIYVQFWSEPQEPVSAEVSSGEWSPGTVKYVRQPQRDFLQRCGFEVGGRAKNFHNEIVISTATEAEATAREALTILYEGFGYRGQWPLNLMLHRGERADQRPTYTSVTPEDFAKLASAGGAEAQVTGHEGPGTPVVLLRHGRHRFVAIMERQVPDNNLYSLISLRTTFTPPKPLSDDVLLAVNSALPFMRLERGEGDELWGYMPVSLEGGVTASWLSQSLAEFLHSRRHTESLLRKRLSTRRVKAGVH